jgi:sterol desaturase/sphingolipid hydroxylase (fatty acid hydroxylase superfamily)
MNDLPDPVLWAIPAFVALVLIERWRIDRDRPGAFDLPDGRTSMALGLGSIIGGLLTGGLGAAVIYGIWTNRLFDLPWTWPVWIAAFVAYDLAYYWSHRLAHRVRYMWTSHVVHHSSERYNLTTALRQPWTSFFSLAWVAHVPLFLIGFDPRMIAFCAGLNLVYQFWIHTERVGKMPRWFEWLLNTPSHHRVHHATNPRYLDRNFAGVFMAWDRLFGTFEPERADDAPRYGLVHDIGHHNVLKAALWNWVELWREVRLARGPAAKLNALLRPPGWGGPDSADAIRARWRAG